MSVPNASLPGRVRLGALGLALLLLLVDARPGFAHYVKLAGELVEKGHLTIGLALAGAPFSYRRDGILQGFEIAVAEAVAAAHGLTLRIERLPRDGLVEALTAGRVDAIATLALPDEPSGLQRLPYLTTGDHIMILKGNPFRIDGPQDLAGRTVSVTSGSSAEDFAHAISEAHVSAGRDPMDIHSLPDQRFTHFPVSMGHAAAYFARTVSAVAISQDPESRTHLLPGAFQPQREAGYALRPDSKNLIHAVEHALAAMVATGKYQTLLETYALPAEISAFQ